MLTILINFSSFSQALVRSRYLRQNAGFIPHQVEWYCVAHDSFLNSLQSFLMRKHFFNDKDSGVFKTSDDAPSTPLTAMGGNRHSECIDYLE